MRTHRPIRNNAAAVPPPFRDCTRCDKFHDLGLYVCPAALRSGKEPSFPLFPTLFGRREERPEVRSVLRYSGLSLSFLFYPASVEEACLQPSPNTVLSDRFPRASRVANPKRGAVLVRDSHHGRQARDNLLCEDAPWLLCSTSSLSSYLLLQCVISLRVTPSSAERDIPQQTGVLRFLATSHHGCLPRAFSSPLSNSSQSLGSFSGARSGPIQHPPVQALR